MNKETSYNSVNSCYAGLLYLVKSSSARKKEIMKLTINGILIKSIFLIGISLMVGCKKQEVEGIKIGDTLVVH